MAKTFSAIQTVTVGSGGVSSVSFTNIPQNYTDLKVLISARETTALIDPTAYIAFNGSSSTFSFKWEYGTGSSAGSTGGSSNQLWDPSGSSATSSTFGNAEFYIPNYTSSTNKSFGFNSVQENNATYGSQILGAGIWGTTSPISIITFTPSSGTFVSGSTFTLYGIGSGAKATGGTVTGAGNYIYHTFLSSGTFTPTESIKNAEVLCLAGGGAGTYNWGGGGGAGGLLYTPGQNLVAGTTYTVTVGAGAATQTSAAIANGSNTYFGSIMATGGGGGGNNSAGGNGGSGGGGGYGPSLAAGGTGIAGQGYAGGAGKNTNPPQTSGGGGGAGGVGQDAALQNQSGSGGSGSAVYSSWHAATNTGVNVGGAYFIAGGGGGGGYTNNTYFSGAAGVGGGGYGGEGSGSAGGAGTANTGGGGGGGAGGNGYGGAGGSGLVIIRYPVLS